MTSFSTLEETLKTLYYDPKSPIAYSNSKYIYQYLKNLKLKFQFTLEDINKWLSTQDAFTLHNQKRLNRKYAPVYANTPHYMYDVDTAFFKEGKSKFSKFIIFVDVFSRMTHAEPVKNLKSDTIIQAFERAFKVMKPPLKVRSDRGKEFLNQYLR